MKKLALSLNALAFLAVSLAIPLVPVAAEEIHVCVGNFTGRMRVVDEGEQLGHGLELVLAL